MTLYFNAHRLACDYADIPGKTWEFAWYRFKRAGIAAHQHSALQPLPPSTYGAVAAFDVLEHLPDIRHTLKQLNQTLLPGGFFLSKSTFEVGGAHLAHNAAFQNMDVLN